MSAIIEGGWRKAGVATATERALPLLADADLSRAFAWHAGRAVSAGEFLAEVVALAQRLPHARYAVNLCEDRYRFLVSFCAVALSGQTNLLPPSRAPQAVRDALHAYPSSYALGDQPLDPEPERWFRLPCDKVEKDTLSIISSAIPTLAANHIVGIAFTSGSTGLPKANAKPWGSVNVSSALNLGALRDAAGDAPNILATVPAQHMYGLELSVLLPLTGRAAIHSGHPLFPADVARMLAEMPAPRVLVTTPHHLRALLQDDAALPALAAIVTATAPLDAELAARAEQRYASCVIELFGSTETCVIAQRRAARDEAWSLYEGIDLHPQPDGTLVTAAHLSEPTLLQDIVELLPQRRFRLCGRNSDLLEIAGKRASLADLTQRLIAIPGVRDGVIFQLDPDASGVRRLAALAVAPHLSAADILAGLRTSIDPIFLPRPLRCVTSLPRNATGKLPRKALLAALDART